MGFGPRQVGWHLVLDSATCAEAVLRQHPAWPDTTALGSVGAGHLGSSWPPFGLRKVQAENLEHRDNWKAVGAHYLSVCNPIPPASSPVNSSSLTGLPGQLPSPCFFEPAELTTSLHVPTSPSSCSQITEL